MQYVDWLLYCYEFSIRLVQEKSWTWARHEHVKVSPFGVSYTEGKEEGWATKLCDHII